MLECFDADDKIGVYKAYIWRIYTDDKCIFSGYFYEAAFNAGSWRYSGHYCYTCRSILVVYNLNEKSQEAAYS
jgi:hypothetical protein